MASAMELLNQASPTSDPLVLQTLIRTFNTINYLLTDLPEQSKFQEFARKKLQPVLQKVGWNPTNGEDVNTAQMRATLLFTLAAVGDKSVIAQANTYFDKFLKNPGTLSAEIRAVVLAIVAENADDRRWKQIYRLAQNAKSVVEQQEYYALLGSSHNKSIAAKALLLGLEKKTPKTLRLQLLRVVAGRFPVLAFDFAWKHHDWVQANLEPGSITSFVPRIVSGAYDQVLIDKLNVYAAKYIPDSARQETQKAIANIKYQAEIREKRIPELQTWLESQHL
jgi:aminopeptidase N